jgi:hypothetical protein
MKTLFPPFVHALRLFTFATITALIAACSSAPSSQQDADSQPASAPVEVAPVQEIADEQPDKGVFVGRYSGVEEESGANHLLDVQMDNGKLMLAYRAGGTMEFSYGEKSIEEIKKGSEYLLNTEDFDGNGPVGFLFKCNTEGKSTEVVATWLDNKDMKPVVMKLD